MLSADDPFTLIIFGASGDLTRRKLIPALFALYASRTLPEPFAIIAIARTEMIDEEFRRRMREAVAEFGRVQPASEAVWERFARTLTYLTGDPKNPALYPRLQALLAEIERGRGPENRLFYCATPPSLYDDIVEHLGIHTITYSTLAGGEAFIGLFEGDPDLEDGKAIRVGFDLAQVHLFDSRGLAVY